MCSVLVVLVKLSLLAKWLARKTPLRKPYRGEGIISRKPRLKRAYDCIGLLYSFVVLLHDICVLPRPYVIHFLLLWHDIACLCWKCRKTPTNSLTNLPSEWLETLVLDDTSTQRPGWRVWRMCCLFVLLCLFVRPLKDSWTSVVWYSVFVLTVPLNTSEPTFRP